MGAICSHRANVKRGESCLKLQCKFRAVVGLVEVAPTLHLHYEWPTIKNRTVLQQTLGHISHPLLSDRHCRVYSILHLFGGTMNYGGQFVHIEQM